MLRRVSPYPIVALEELDQDDAGDETAEVRPESHAAGFSANINPYRYTGKRQDNASNTLDMGARRYSRSTNRFLQYDYYDGALANLGLSLHPLSNNRYALAGGNPVNYVEVDGHMVEPVVGGKPTLIDPCTIFPKECAAEKKAKDEEKKDDRKKDTEKIEVETSLIYTAPKANPEGLLFRIKEGKLTSTNPTKGTIFFDSKNGRIASAEISIDLKGDLMVTIGGSDTKVELQQNQKTTIKAGDTSFLPKK